MSRLVIDVAAEGGELITREGDIIKGTNCGRHMTRLVIDLAAEGV
jgi:hypothetical protein